MASSSSVEVDDAGSTDAVHGACRRPAHRFVTLYWRSFAIMVLPPFESAESDQDEALLQPRLFVDAEVLDKGQGAVCRGARREGPGSPGPCRLDPSTHRSPRGLACRSRGCRPERRLLELIECGLVQPGEHPQGGADVNRGGHGDTTRSLYRSPCRALTGRTISRRSWPASVRVEAAARTRAAATGRGVVVPLAHANVV